MDLGKFDINNNYRNYSLLELNGMALDDDNKLAVSILNKFDEHVEIESFRIRDEIIQNISEVDIFSIMKLLNEYDDYEIKWNEHIESYKGYKKEYHYLNDFDENHYENHNIHIFRTNYSGSKKGNFILSVNHDTLGEYHYDVKLGTNNITKAKSLAIDELKHRLANDDLRVILP